MAILSCGHEATWTPSAPHASGTVGKPAYYPTHLTNGKPLAMTTGTAHTPDGREICHPCAEREEEKAFLSASTFCAYLSEAPSDGTSRWPDTVVSRADGYVTNWTGGILARVVSLKRTRAGFGGERYYFRAVDRKGRVWSGNSPGPGMFCRLRLLGS